MDLLDSNVVSELRRVGDGKAYPDVTGWAENLSATSVHISDVFFIELEKSVISMERKEPAQGAMLRKWLDNHVVPFFRSNLTRG